MQLRKQKKLNVVEKAGIRNFQKQKNFGEKKHEYSSSCQKNRKLLERYLVNS